MSKSVNYSIEYNGKEVQNPVARIVVATFAIIGCLVLFTLYGFVILPIFIGIVAFAFLLTIPIHFILRLCGRRGFYVLEDGTHTWKSEGAFERR